MKTHLVSNLQGGGPSRSAVIQINPDLFHPSFDFDFANIVDTQKYFRGGREYKRPCGSQRFALKVIGKFADEKWLGSSNEEGEWPVSYHGTKKEFVDSILSQGFKPGPRQAYKAQVGCGVYSSPEPSIAFSNATTFMDEGEKFKLIFQNRVDPTVLKEVDTSMGPYWVSPLGDTIRP